MQGTRECLLGEAAETLNKSSAGGTNAKKYQITGGNYGLF